MTYDEFIASYNKYGKCVNQIRSPKNKLNDKQLKFQYEKYLQKNNIVKENNIDQSWILTREEVFSRDDSKCQLRLKLKPHEEHIVRQSLFPDVEVIDPAHVFGKGAFPHMKYDVENIVCLTRLFHSRLDTYHDPITGSLIDKNDHEQWWRRIIGDSQYNKLKRKALKR